MHEPASISSYWAGVAGRVVALLSIVMLALAAITPTRASATGARTTTLDLAAIDRYVLAQMRAAHLPGLALAIVQGDQIVHLKGFGTADQSGRPVTPQTPFTIGSTGKSMTALAIMQLVEAGKVELDTPVQRYLPWFRVADPDVARRITVRHLLNHSSGIPTPAGLRNVTSQDTSDSALENRVRALSSVTLMQPPGATFQYSNANYETLGLIVQVVSGQSYEAYVQQHIFAPLDMNNSFLFREEAREQGAATGYRYWFGLPVPFEMRYNRGIVPAGFIFSSAEDMAHYLIAHLNGGRYGSTSVLSPAGIAELHRPAVRTAGGPIVTDEFYAMGWFVREKDGLMTVSHAGSTPNFHTNLVLIPEGEWGIVLLMNAENGLRPERISGMAQGVTGLIVGRQPWDLGPGDFFPTILSYILVGSAVQTVGMLRSVVLLRRWRAHPERRPRGTLRLVWHVVLPFVLNLLWGLALLLALPAFIRTSLSELRLFVPDLSAMLLLSGGVALGWALLRTALVIRALRLAPAPAGVALAGGG